VDSTDRKLEEGRDYVVFTYQQPFLKSVRDYIWTIRALVLAGAVNFLFCIKTPPALEGIQLNK
jgi:hypothetical protein